MAKFVRRDNTRKGKGKTKTTTRNCKIAIIGGGIAGLYAARLLDARGEPDFLVAEQSAHIGGRIWSTRILGSGIAADDNSSPQSDGKGGFKYGKEPVEFVAEFGPMRIELELQHRLKGLITDLGLKDDLQKFPPYASPTSRHDPTYELQEQESNEATPLDLLQLAIARIVGRLIPRRTADDLKITQSGGRKHSAPEPSPKDKQEIGVLRETLRQGVESLTRATATRQPDWKIFFSEWIRTLDEPDYQRLREYGALDDGTKYKDETAEGIALWNMGFWNLLSEVLSHHAVLKVRDLGTFYHLIPENPNAAEWLIFWLRALRTSERMVGIRGGMQRITEALAKTIDSSKKRPKRILRGLKLARISTRDDGRMQLVFNNERGRPIEEWTTEHVVLALPRGPMEELARANPEVFCEEVVEDIKSVFGFPLLKFFVSVKKKWWTQDETMTNRYATRIPTRELHFRSSSVPDSSKGLILVYTDRPATGFWSNYIRHSPSEEQQQAISEGKSVFLLSGMQSEPEQGGPNQNIRLINKALQYLHAHGVQLDSEDIEFYGIRDWGREPYLGAAHAWFPERQSWTILKKLAAFAPGAAYADAAEGARILHVCGEAYSDYQAFIEGALRSAEHVLHMALPQKFKESPTWWLCEKPNCGCQKKRKTRSVQNERSDPQPKG